MSETMDQQPPARGGSGWQLWGVVAALALLVGVGLFGERGMMQAYHLYQQKLVLEGEIQALRSESQTLRQEIDRLNQDPDHIEQVARTELGMVRDQEIVYQFPTNR